MLGTLGPMTEVEKEFPPKSFSFSPSGWLGVYYCGVAKCLQVHGLAGPDVKFIGSSGGSLVAVALVLGLDFDKLNEELLKLVDKVHGSFYPSFQMRKFVRDVLQLFVKEGDEDRLNERLTVSVTAIAPWVGSRRYKKFSSRKDLLQALVASSCMPPIAGLPFVYRGELVFDGGFADYQPIFDSQTVTVSAMYFSDADIKPSRYIPIL